MSTRFQIGDVIKFDDIVIINKDKCHYLIVDIIKTNGYLNPHYYKCYNLCDKLIYNFYGYQMQLFEDIQ